MRVGRPISLRRRSIQALLAQVFEAGEELEASEVTQGTSHLTLPVRIHLGLVDGHLRLMA